MTVCAILGQEEIIRHASDLLELSEDIARIIPQHPTMEGDLLRETISEHRVIARIHCKTCLRKGTVGPTAAMQKLREFQVRVVGYLKHSNT